MINGNNKLKDIVGISNLEKQRIIDFLQGAVYSWCKNKKNEWFALRDLMGGDNYYWEGTPLIALYKKHEDILEDWEQAVKEAGKDAGWLLKEMIINDKREFDTKKEELTRKYKWTGKELKPNT